MLVVMYRVFVAAALFPVLIMGTFTVWQMTHPQSESVSPNTAPQAPHRFTNAPAAVAASSATASTTTPPRPHTPAVTTAPETFLPYLEITGGCAVTIDDTCVQSYSQPTTTSRVRTALRKGMILAIKNSTTTSDGTVWHEIHFPEHLRYAARLSVPWYVRAEAGAVHYLPAPADLSASTSSSTKHLIVDRSEQRVYAYDNGDLVRTYVVSTGLELTPTPRGTFRIYRKTPSRYMQGPIPGISTKYYDLPGVPWNLYFTEQGAIVHGAYWHNNFGNQHSNGCVNVDPREARELYEWADLGMLITVRD